MMIENEIPPYARFVHIYNRNLRGKGIIEISGNMVTIEGENPQDVVAVHLNWDTEIVNGRNGNDVDFMILSSIVSLAVWLKCTRTI